MIEVITRYFGNDVKVKPGYEEIIRCKDCRYWHDAEEGYVECSVCERLMLKWTHLIGDQFFEAGPDDYCSFAVKSNKEHNEHTCCVECAFFKPENSLLGHCFYWDKGVENHNFACQNFEREV